MELINNIRELIEPVVASHDCYIDEIEYLKEKNEWYLKVYVELNTGNLDMDTCVAVSEAISEKLDEADLIKNEYYLEVSSPGIEKELKSLDAIAHNIDQYVYVILKDPKAGMSEFYGYVKAVNDQTIQFIYLVKNIKKTIELDYENIKFIRLAVKF